MKNKQIILSVIIIFIALISYKFISSNIQENKEKAVLQEKSQLQALEKEPLNKCIEEAETIANSNRQNNTILTYTIFSNSYKDCISPTGHGTSFDARIASGEINLKDYCAPPTPQQVETEKQKIINEEQIAKEECYKRYK